MPLTPTQIAERAKGIGASEAGAILGLDPFASAYDVWLRKTGKVGDVETNDAIEWGNDLEEVIGKRAARVLNCRVTRPTHTYRHQNGIMLANLDFEADLPTFGPSPLEAKSTGIMDGWGEDDSDQVPDRVWAQVQVQMMCRKAQVAKVARMLGRYGFKFTIYTVQLADPDMQNDRRLYVANSSANALDATKRISLSAGQNITLQVDNANLTWFNSSHNGVKAFLLVEA